MAAIKINELLASVRIQAEGSPSLKRLVDAAANFVQACDGVAMAYPGILSKRLYHWSVRLAEMAANIIMALASERELKTFDDLNDMRYDPHTAKTKVAKPPKIASLTGYSKVTFKKKDPE